MQDTLVAPVIFAADVILPGNEGELNVADVFALCKVQYEWNGRLTHLAVRNNILCLGLSNLHIQRIDLARPHIVDDVELTKRTDDAIHQLFLDSTGRHLLVSMKSGDNFYMHQTWKKPKLLAKIKNLVLECVAWYKHDPASTRRASTGPILLGTKTGAIYEAEIDPTDEFKKREERLFKQIYSLPEEEKAITGIYFDRMPMSTTESHGPERQRYFIIVTTLHRIYQFIGDGGVVRGDSILEPIFSRYTNPPFQELPGDLDYGALHILKDLDTFDPRPRAFAWLTGPGVYYGDMVIEFGKEAVIENAQLLPYAHQSVQLMAGIPLKWA